MSDLIEGIGIVNSSLQKVSVNGKRYFVVKIDGITGTTFDLGLGSSAKEGVYGKYAFKPDGAYKNLISFQPEQGDMGAIQGLDNSPASGRAPDATAMRIARSHALTSGIAIAVPTAKAKESAEEILNRALDIAEKVQIYTVTGRNPLAGPNDPLYAEATK